MLKVILLGHLLFALTACLILATRIVQIIKKQDRSLYRNAFYLMAAMLTISGVLLSAVGHLPITTICLQSLAIITSVMLIDYTLVLVKKKISEPVEK